jgi:hypothetical protein
MLVDTSTPVPPARHEFKDLLTLKVGESTTFPLDLYSNLCPVLAHYKRKYKLVFRRKTERPVVRVWRIK